MAEVTVHKSNGRQFGKGFNTNVDPEDEDACTQLVRKHAPKGGSIKIKGKKGWKEYR